MKLSVSAYRAQASAHKKILSNYQHQLSYGATYYQTTTSARSPSDPAAVLPGFKVDRAENEEAQGGGLAPPASSYHHHHHHQRHHRHHHGSSSHGAGGSSSGRMGQGGPGDSGSSAPSSVPHSLATSRDEEDDDEEESSGRRSDGHGGSRSWVEVTRLSRGMAARRATSLRVLNKSFSGAGSSLADASSMSVSIDEDDEDGCDEEEEDGEAHETTSNSLDVDTELPAAAGARRPRNTRGSQKWSNVRAVMALYSSLRKIKRTKSNQRWMKLRTTVQLSSAVSAIQKKPVLKREDSFLKKFSTRHIPESQETIDTGEGEGDQSDDKNSHRRRRRPRRPQKPPKTVVNPDENFYYYWLMLLSACVLYNLWTLIVRQSMPELQAVAPAIWLSCDGFTDLIFFLDVGVQFRTGYLEQGLMVYNSKKLAGHYFKSKSFILDLLALLPLDLLQVNLGTNPMLRFPRFLKVYRVYNYYYMVESRTVYPNLWRVLNLIHILLILAHWFGCFYYLLSEAEGFHGDWVYPYRPGEYETLTRKYLGSLYWSTLTLTTIGDLPTPETNAEYVFTIVSYLIGVFIFATIVGQVGNVITNRNANRLEFERLLDGAKTYMRHHKVPGGMKRRVLRWYDYSWSRGRIQGGGDINTALGLLPDKLKTELALHVNLSVLKKVTIFQECQPEFLHDLVLKMKAYIFTPGDSICRKGEVAREMFIIADGILEVISETGRVLTTMKAGDFFGEIGILNLDGLNKRTADVRSVGYSELFSLSREDVLAALKDYPEAQEILKKLGEKRLREAQRVARSFRHPPSPGHDSSDNSTGKRIVDKLKSDVKGLKNVLRKSRRNTRPEDGLELQPLTTKVLRRQTRIDESQDVCTSVSEPPVSPLGAGLPLLSRLRLLKEKQDREEKRTLMETANQFSEQLQTTVEIQNPTQSTSVAVPLLHRLLHMKSKAEPETVIDRESIVAKEPLLPRSVIPEESEIFVTSEQNEIKTIIRSPTSASVDVENGGVRSKPWAMLKDASIKTGSSMREATSTTTTTTTMGTTGHEPRHHRSGSRHVQIRQSFVHLRSQQSTKMYASVDDLSPEYCGLPFVKKLKILNERQKLAELEKVVRSSSLDCGESTEAEFDGSLTRSHSEACAIEYARKLAKLNKERRRIAGVGRVALTSPDQLSPENETLERRNLKSILKKLSASSRAGSHCSAETSSTSCSRGTPRAAAVATAASSAELRKLMRAPTLEGYAARHSKLSKSVTFNKYTLQSPPGTDTTTNAQASVSAAAAPGPAAASGQASTTTTAPAGGTATTSSYAIATTSGHQPSTSSLSLVPRRERPGDDGDDDEDEDDDEVGRDLQVEDRVVGVHHLALEQQPLPPLPTTKVSFRPLGSGAVIAATQLLHRPMRQDECIDELVTDIRDAVQTRLETIQGKFERQFTSLELEIRKRDEIIHQLQARILDLEKNDSDRADDDESGGDSTTHDASMEEEFAEDNEDHPFMRDGSVDTVLGASSHPRRRFSSPSSVTDSSAGAYNRRSWEEHSEEETLELQDLPRSITPQSLWKDEVAIDLGSSDDSSEEEIMHAAGGSGLAAIARTVSGSISEDDEEDDDGLLDENGHNNWEVAMLAQELEKRRRSSECSSPGS